METLIIALGASVFGSLAILRGFAEKYFTSDIRKEANELLFNFYILIGVTLFLPLVLIFLLQYGYILGFDPGYFFPVVMFLILISIIIIDQKFSRKSIEEAKRLKMADEMYLERAESFSPRFLLFDSYKFNTWMIRYIGKGGTALLYILILSLPLVSWVLYTLLFENDLYYGITLFFIGILILGSISGYYKFTKYFKKAEEKVQQWRVQDKDY